MDDYQQGYVAGYQDGFKHGLESNVDIKRLRAALRHVCDIYEQTGSDEPALMYSYAKAALRKGLGDANL